MEDPRDSRLLICCKFYDMEKGELQIVKFVYPEKSEKIGQLHDEMVEALQLPAGTKLQCLEELQRLSYTSVDQAETHTDAQLQHGDILVWSLDNKATTTALNTLCSEITINWRGDLQQELCAAVEGGDDAVDAVRKLLVLGCADPNTGTTVAVAANSTTPLMLATQKGHAAVKRLLK